MPLPLCALLCVGCVVGAARRPTQSESASGPPPAPARGQTAQQLLAAPAPDTGALPEGAHGPAPAGRVWVAGYWHWDGVDYVWVPGRWEQPPRAP
jgi:hypothetical protein